MSNIFVNICGKEVCVEITKKRIKNMYLRVNDGIIYVNANRYITNDEIIKIIKTREDYIYKKLIESKKENIIHLFGTPYEPVFIVGKTPVYIQDNKIYISTLKDDETSRKKALYRYYLDNLNKYILSIIDEVKNDFKDIRFPSIKYRVLKSEYGNYNSRKHEITLSVLLAKYDFEYIKSVLYHELSHVYVFNHSNEFYKVYESKFNNAKKIQHQLRQTRYKDIF